MQTNPYDRKQIIFTYKNLPLGGRNYKEHNETFRAYSYVFMFTVVVVS